MHNQLHVIAVLHAKPERLDTVIGLFESLASPSRNEPGCIEYRFVQDVNNPSVILSRELWKDEDAFEKHLASPHFRSAFEQLDPLLQDQPTIHVCKTIV